MPDLHWFRRDLRIDDNPALAAAGPDAVAVFIHDPRLAGVGRVRQDYLDAALKELNTQRTLVRRHGEPGAERARRVYCAGDSTPFAARRDDAVEAVLAAHGIELRRIDSPFAVPPGELRTQAGAGFRVFTPFYKAWIARGWGPAGPPVATNAARARWEEFRTTRLSRYQQDRDFPDIPATSRLSAALHFGQIHPRTILSQIPDPTTDPFARQLAWREFCAEVLWQRPDAVWASLDRRFDTHMQYSDNEDHFQAWTQGRTGYPFVDAGMRQLLAEGWMHNRLRMVTASFLVKDLHLPWQKGARWFLEHLVDADVANNQIGWQWVAGCGTDAAPYFRIFNPVVQGRRFDPDGHYIRRYVPELAHLDDPHEPGIFAGDYPPPLVDHRRERDVALSRFQALPPK